MRTFRSIALPSLLALMLASPLIGCGRNLTPEESIAKAKELMDKGEVRPALIELSNAAQKNPNLMEIRWLLAKAAIELGEGARAEKEVRKAMELGQTKQAAQPLLAKAILLQGDYDRVLKETESVPEDMASANKAAVLGLRGQARIAQGKPDLAKPILEDALRIDPHSLPALIGMTAWHGTKREYDEARRWAELALKAEPNSPDPWSALGDLELAQDNTAKAEADFTNAIKQRRFAGLDTAKRALVRIQLKKFTEAGQDINALKQQGLAKHPYVSYVAGRLFFGQKKYPEAAEAFEASQSAEPNNRLNTLYLGVTYHLLGQQEKALALATRLSAEAPRSATAKRLLGSVQIARSDYDAAKESLDAALANSPNNFNLLNMLATVSMLEGDKAKGMEYASRLVSLIPDSPQAKMQLMAAKLIAGQPLDAKQSGAGGEDAYTTEFLFALDAFRNKRFAETLKRVDQLHAHYPDRVDPLKLKAAVYLAAAQWDKAKPELEQALKLQPNEPSATKNLAKVELILGNAKRARELLQPYVKLQPGDEAAVLLLADVEARLGNLAAIPPLLAQTVQRNPDAQAARARLALEYLRTGKFQNVLEITKGLSDDQYRQQPALLELRGKALMQTGDARSARSTFAQWAKLLPQSAPAQFYLGDNLARGGDAAGARKALERALQLNPRYLPARIGEIRMMVHNNQIEAARKALAILQKDFGDQPEVLGLAGWFALGTGDFANSEKSLAAALAKRPDSELAILLVRAQWGQKKHEAALKTMSDWLKPHPNDLAMLMQLAGAQLSLNHNEEARAAYARVVERYPNQVVALNNLAWLSQDKDLNQAIAYARQAETLAPKNATVKDTLGMLTLRRGDAPGALRQLQEAARLSPADPQIQLHYGQLLAKQQRTAEARKVLQELLKKAPDSAQAKEAKALLDSLGK